MNEVDLVAKFTSLFAGRTDAYGTEEGGCWRPDNTYEPTPTQMIMDHLNGSNMIGIYPIMPDNQVWWGCVDFDEGEDESFIHATNLQNVLAELDVTAWVERSRSKGFHVWVFASSPLPASVMRRALLGATQIAQAPVREINPKSEQLADGQVGNYVRLPYPGHLGDHWVENRRVVVVNGDPIELEEFVYAAWLERTDPEVLHPLVGLWVPPAVTVAVTPEIENVIPDGALPSTNRMAPLTHHVWRNGPSEIGDRSSCLWKTANLLRADGYSRNETLRLVSDADIRWGKHHANNTINYLEKMVDKVYAQ